MDSKQKTLKEGHINVHRTTLLTTNYDENILEVCRGKRDIYTEKQNYSNSWYFEAEHNEKIFPIF